MKGIISRYTLFQDGTMSLWSVKKGDIMFQTGEEVVPNANTICPDNTAQAPQVLLDIKH